MVEEKKATEKKDDKKYLSQPVGWTIFTVAVVLILVVSFVCVKLAIA